MPIIIVKNSKGFSLVEILVAAGVSSIIALAVMKSQTTQTKHTKTVFDRQEIASLRFQVENVLRRNCTENITTDGAFYAQVQGLPADGTGAAVTMTRLDFFNNDGTPGVNILESGVTRLGGTASNWLVNSISFQRLGESNCQLNYDLNNTVDQSNFGANQLSFNLPLSCNYNDLANITCSLDSASNLWELNEDGTIGNWLRNTNASVGFVNISGNGDATRIPDGNLNIYNSNEPRRTWSDEIGDNIAKGLSLPENHMLYWGGGSWDGNTGYSRRIGIHANFLPASSLASSQGVNVNFPATHCVEFGRDNTAGGLDDLNYVATFCNGYADIAEGALQVYRRPSPLGPPSTSQNRSFAHLENGSFYIGTCLSIPGNDADQIVHNTTCGAKGDRSFVLGHNNFEQAQNSIVTGRNNKMYDFTPLKRVRKSAIIGGENNQIFNLNSTSGGNTTELYNNGIFAGESNIIANDHATNSSQIKNSVILGGIQNHITAPLYASGATSLESIILGGQGNDIETANNSAIINSFDSNIQNFSDHSTIIGGRSNWIFRGAGNNIILSTAEDSTQSNQISGPETGTTENQNNILVGRNIITTQIRNKVIISPDQERFAMDGTNNPYVSADESAIILHAKNIIFCWEADGAGNCIKGLRTSVDDSLVDQAQIGVFTFDGPAGVSDFSDQRLKTLLEGSFNLNQLAQISGYQFYFNQDQRKKTRFGVLAQEVEKVYPELVSADSEGRLRVDYQGLMAPMLEGIKELKAQNEQLKQENQDLKAQLQDIARRVHALESP